MKVLFVSSFALFRETRFGGAKRLYYFAAELARTCDLHLLCVDGCREWGGGDPLPEFPRSLYLPLGGRKSPWRRAFSPSVDIDEDLERHGPAIEAFLRDADFDATLFAFPLSLSFLGKGQENRLGKIVYLEDDLLLESYRNRPAGRLAGLKSGWRHRQTLAYYRRKLARARAFIAISSEEREVVRSLFPGLPAPILKYGLPLEEYPFLPPPEDPMTLGFIGNYRHGPNLDAALWLATELWPEIEVRIPSARLVLAGRDIPESLKAACSGRRSIRLWEDVPDLAGFYGSIGTFINPIRTGRGLRTKVVEAAAFGRPVVSTPLGSEGLEELSILRWSGPTELIRLLEDLREPGRHRALAEANRKRVEESFSMESLGQALAGILRP